MARRHDGHQSFKKVKKKRKGLRIFLIVLLILGTVGSFYASTIWSSYRNLINKLNIDDIDSTEVKNLQTDPFAILILGEGTNNYDDESGADSISLLVINPKDNVARLIGIPRDSYLPRAASCDYPRYFDKITNSGTDIQCIQDTLEDLFNIDINYYVSINFISFVKIVDAIGGVEMNVPDLREGFEAWTGDIDDGTYLDPDLKTGDQWCEHNSNREPYQICFTQFGWRNVDGEQALALARSRHYDSDFARGERQMELIKAIVRKVTKNFNPLTVNSILQAAEGNIKTNIPENLFMDFAKLGRNLMGNKNSPFIIQNLQLDGAADTYDTELSGQASVNLVSIFSIEDIRMKIAQTMTPDLPVQVNVEAFYFNPYRGEYASKYADYKDEYPYFLTEEVDINDPDEVKVFHYSTNNQNTTTATIKR